MRQVREHLFLGNITDAYSVLDSTEKPKVTHLLSVFEEEFLRQDFTPKNLKSSHNFNPRSLRSLIMLGAGNQNIPLVTSHGNSVAKSPRKRELVRKTVPLRDMESENLLDHLESCMEFIDEGRKTGDVLVHCLAGISRSASVVTAYLMRTENLSVNDALASLRLVSKGVCPNDGFIAQLRMFEEMGYKVNHESPIFKQFHVRTSRISSSSWLSFLDDTNNVVRGASLRRSSLYVHNVDPPGNEKFKVEEAKLKGRRAPTIRVRTWRLCRRIPDVANSFVDRKVYSPRCGKSTCVM